MGYVSYVTHRTFALVLTGCALFLGFAAWGMYLQGALESAALSGGLAVLVGFSAGYFWQTLH